MGGRDSDGGGLWTPLCSGRIFELSGVPDWPLNPATSQPPFPEFVQSVNECVCLLWRAGWQAQVESFDGAKWQEEPPLLVRTSGAQALFAGEMLYVIGLCSFILCVIRLCSLTLNPNMRAFDSLSLSLSLGGRLSAGGFSYGAMLSTVQAFNALSWKQEVLSHTHLQRIG